MRLGSTLLHSIALGALLLVGGRASAAIPKNGVYTGCYQKTSGTIYLIDADLGQACQPNYTRVTWNQTGVQGLQGIQGIQGLKGDTGATGAQGPKGDTGLTGAQGLKGDTGATGSQGPKGDTGLTGAQGLKGDTGLTGLNGKSVTADPVASGIDPSCWYGGTKFSMDGETLGYACSGAPGPQGELGPQGSKGDQGVQGVQGPVGPTGDTGATGATGPTGPSGSAITAVDTSRRVYHLMKEGRLLARFYEAENLGSTNEAVEHSVTLPDGSTSVEKFPGRLVVSDIALRRGFQTNLGLSNWRDQVTSGPIAAARSDVTIELRDSRGAVVASWMLSNAWPSSLLMDTARAGTAEPVEELTIAAEEVTHVVAPASSSWPDAEYAVGLDVPGVLSVIFVAGTGFGSSTEVVTSRYTSPSGIERSEKRPGRLVWSDQKLTCNGPCPAPLVAWRQQVVDGMITAARVPTATVTLYQARAAIGSWTLSNAWPASMVMSTSAGVDREQVVIVAEGIARQ